MSSTGQIIGAIVGAVVGFFTPIGPVYDARAPLAVGRLIPPPREADPSLDEATDDAGEPTQ